MHRLSPICVSRSNSLIFNFANKKTSMARSTFKVLFYVNGSKEKDGIVPIMGRVTINGTVAQFSCKQTIPKTLWDAKGNRAKGKSAEARNINLALDNIKAQIIKHYQRVHPPSDHIKWDAEFFLIFGCPSKVNSCTGSLPRSL